MPNIITSELARRKTDENLRFLGDITAKRWNRANELRQNRIMKMQQINQIGNESNNNLK